VAQSCKIWQFEDITEIMELSYGSRTKPDELLLAQNEIGEIALHMTA